MLVYLDTAIIIYAIEGDPPFRARAQTHLAALLAAGHGFAVSALSRQECRMKPLRIGAAAVLAEYDLFFASSDVSHFSLPDPVFERATHIQAVQGFKLADSLHLAVAVEFGCDQFLTNDMQLARFTDIPVVILP
jgi:uncharacterized protein